MYVIVLRSKKTEELFGAAQTLSGQPRKFPDYALAMREAHELNLRNDLLDQGIEWFVKEDDDIYWDVDGEECGGCGKCEI